MNSILFSRSLVLETKQSFFLFGARGTGKSTLLTHKFPKARLVNLLDPDVEDRFSRQPNLLESVVEEVLQNGHHQILIDEVQKAPRLLDMVHLFIEKKLGLQFIMTGSSARKLKRGASNLLAGRAHVYYLDPFSFLEVGSRFELEHSLSWGMLPKVYQLDSSTDRNQFLRSYAHTYLKEEIAQEQLVRKINPFRQFLEVAAQCAGKKINLKKIGLDCGVSDKTVAEYFSILVDTMIGFELPAFHHSFRKRMRSTPKFYFFDVGIQRSLAGTLSLPPQTGTSYYGELFEQFIVCEIHKVLKIYSPDTKMSYLETAGGLEIDLVIEAAGKPKCFVEIKSTKWIQAEDVRAFEGMQAEFPDATLVCLSQDPNTQRLQYGVEAVHWQKGIAKIIENFS